MKDKRRHGRWGVPEKGCSLGRQGAEGMAAQGSFPEEITLKLPFEGPVEVFS
jgi:hypothetical protein